jgi:hypothetical protein
VSDADYQQLTADIYWDGAFICKLNQDRGLSDISFEIFPAAIQSDKATIPVNELLAAIEEAKEALRSRTRV